MTGEASVGSATMAATCFHEGPSFSLATPSRKISPKPAIAREKPTGLTTVEAASDANQPVVPTK